MALHSGPTEVSKLCSIAAHIKNIMLDYPGCVHRACLSVTSYLFQRDTTGKSPELV